MSDAGPSLFVVGATHHTAPIGIREKLTLGAPAADALQAQLAALPGLREFALLSTCNRIEFYGVAGDAATTARLRELFCAAQHFPREEFERIQLSLRDRDAIQHLLEVAAGLNSQMLGENEIFGQVKDAYAAAQQRHATGPVLNRVFQKAFQAAKLARSSTAISAGQVSIANVAVDLALDIFGGLDDARILLLGAGDIGEKTAKAFLSRGAGSLTVSSRTLAHALQLATELGATALPFEQREAKLGDYDVVVGSTAAPDVVLTRAAAQAAMRKRPARPLFFIDLALPRDVDPAVADLPNVFLYNLDDLAKIAERNLAAREAEIVKARALLRDRAEALWRHIEPQLRRAADARPQP